MDINIKMRRETSRTQHQQHNKYCVQTILLNEFELNFVIHEVIIFVKCSLHRTVTQQHTKK